MMFGLNFIDLIFTYTKHSFFKSHIVPYMFIFAIGLNFLQNSGVVSYSVIGT
jgi:hypothetical protein